MERKAQSFLSKISTDVNVTTDIKQVVRDFAWIEKIEETIPFIDAIVRNPRRFIVQEEEIIPVEKTKKVTEESIKHLAKHTSLIQDIDKDGDVKPLKLLNVFKEETMDLYENRFIYSLIVNVKTFLNDFLEHHNTIEKSRYIRTLNYNGETSLPGEKVKFNLQLKNEFSAGADEENQALAYEERVKRINEIFSDFLGTQFIKSLQGATPVRSPIRKTNVILKNRNFIKSVDLWEYIEKYDVNEATKVLDNSKNEDVSGIENNLNIASYIQYDSISNYNKKLKTDDQYKFSSAYIRKMIECYMNEHDVDEKRFKNMIVKEFKRAKEIKTAVYDEIRNDYKVNITRHKQRMENALNFLK